MATNPYADFGSSNRSEIQGQHWLIAAIALASLVGGGVLLLQIPPVPKHAANVLPKDALRMENAARVAIVSPVRTRMLEFSRPSPALEDLANIPEVELTKERMSQLTINQMRDSIDKTNRNKPDEFVRQLQNNRPDLAGLPFTLGNACRVRAGFSEKISMASLVGHSLIDQSKNLKDSKYMRLDVPELAALGTESPTIGVFDQIMAPEESGMRLVLIESLKRQKTPAVAKFLVRRAVFEVDENVRVAAVEALAEHPAETYTADLLDALRYPWQPAAVFATDAIVALKRTDLVENLELIRRQPAPDAPATIPGDEHGRFAVRELVRINHARNCFLCHPPAEQPDVATIARLTRFEPGPFPIGLIPAPESPIRSFSGRAYYFRHEEGAFVRADATYLRQDFSVRLPVDFPDPWPKMQRFDFLVRTKTLTPAEAAKLPARTIDETQAGAALRTAIAELRKELAAPSNER